MFSLHFSHLIYQVEHNVTILYQMFFYRAFQRPSGVHSIQTTTQIQRFVRFVFFEAEILPILFFRTLTNKVRKQFIKLKYSVRYFKVLVYSQFFINTDNAINYIIIPSSNFYLIIAFNLAYDKMIVPRIKYIPKYIFLFWCRLFCSL